MVDQLDDLRIVEYEEKCYYCFNVNLETLVQCVICGKWLCNEIFNNRNSTCLAHHLKKSNHNYLMLNKKIKSNNNLLFCTDCNYRNCFSLGYCTKTYKIYCRHPCATKRGLTEENWVSLFENNCLSIPNHDFYFGRNSKLPKDFGNDNDYNEFMESFRIRKIYKSNEEYSYVFINLLEIEKEREESLRKRDNIFNVMLYYKNGKNYFWGYEHNCSFKANSKIIIKIDRFSIRGKLTQIKDQKYYIEKLEVPITTKIQVHISLHDNYSPIPKIQRALTKFSENNLLEPHLNRAILGKGVDDYDFLLKEDYSIPDNKKLNSSQNEAISSALSHNLSLISGPPGTGKTVTAVALIHHIYNFSQDKILVCAYSNVAITLISEKLIEANIDILQIVAIDKIKQFGQEERTLDYKTKEILKVDEEYLQLKEEKLSLKSKRSWVDIEKRLGEINQKMQNLKEKVQNSIIDKYRVICVTCVTSYHKALNDRKYEHIIIDEATQAKEPETFISFLHEPEHIVLIGDVHQLGPFAKSKACIKLGLDISMFERFNVLKYPNSILKIQYRMHPEIAKFPNKTFYNNELINGVSDNERKFDFSLPHPITDNPVTFYNVKGSEENVFRTKVNRYEKKALVDIIDFLYENWVDSSKIGIITFYSGQAGYIQSYLDYYFDSKYYQYHQDIQGEDDFMKKLKIMSVDSCQGKEFDFVILSCVRNNFGDIGFLKSYRRFNVSLTRAKTKLIVIGSVSLLKNKELWENFLYENKNSIVTGKFKNISKYKLNISEPKKYNIPNDDKFLKSD